MEDDWESEDFMPAVPIVANAPPKAMWDDEDADENDVRESWEDEDNNTEPKQSAVSAPDTKSAKNKATDNKEKDKNVEEKKAGETIRRATKVQDEKLADPLAEKLRQQRLVEEADYQSTAELFGEATGQKSLEIFIPKSEDDFLEYAELVAHKLRPYEKSFHYLNLIKAVMRHSMVSLKGADAKDVASAATVIANEKIKSEKEVGAGKKKAGAKKKQLHVDSEQDDLFDGGYVDGNYDDFM